MQTYARSKMDNGLEFDVYRKCVHKIKHCRHCHVIPLLGKNREVVSYFVEHRARKGAVIQCSVGVGSLATKTADQLSENAIRRKAKEVLSKMNVPESGTVPPVEHVTIDKELFGMHHEESILTEPESVEHIQSSLGSQLEQVQTQMKSSFSTPVVRRASRCLEQLVLLVVGLQYDTSLEAIVLRCVQFLSAITEGGIVLTLKDALMKYAGEANMPDLLKGKTVKEAFEVEQHTTNTPEMLSASSLVLWETMKQGVFTKHLSYILGTVFAFSACKIKNVKFNHPIYEKIAEHSNAEEIDGMDLIDHAIKLYNWTATVGMACMESRSLAPLTVNSSTLAKCHEKFYYWQKKFLDFKRDGTSSMEERQLMFVEVETIQKKLEQFTKIQKDKFFTLQASSLHREVLALYNDVRDFVHKIDRVKVAKGYHLVGIPKSGKSTIAPMIQEQICLARGIEYREQDNAQINLMAPYQDELNNATQTITINETLPIKEHLAKSVENAYNTSLALIDPVPYHPNRSNLEDKAKITMTHVGVVSTGNTAQPFMHVAKTPGAWERRYTIIEMSVKPEFADEFGRLMSSKCDGSDDYHFYDVYEIVYTGKQRKIVYDTLDGKPTLKLNTEQLFELIRKQCIDHFYEQDRLARKHKQGKKSGCLKCFRLSHMCHCTPSEHSSMTGASIKKVEASVASVDNTEDVCPMGVEVGKWRSRCKFEGGKCLRCNRADPDVESIEEEANEPEMGLVSTAASTAGSLIWSSVLPWVNPFIKAQWLWSIDNNVMKIFHEEIVEELSFWPDKIGCSMLSMVPKSWEEREDGSKTWYGRKKDSMLRMIAAEKQIFLPLTYLLRRALFWGFVSFLITMSFGYFMEWLGMNPRAYEQVVMIKREYKEWGWYYFYPEYSEYVLSRRDWYADLGIYTENYLNWKDYYVNIYFFEKLLGKICIPWYFTFIKYIPVLEVRMYRWWLMPLVVSSAIAVGLFFFMWFRRWLGFEARYRDLQKRSMSDSNMQKVVYDKIRRHSTEYNSLIPTAVGVVGAVVTGLVIWNSIRNVPEVEITRDNNTKSWSDWFSFNRQVAEPTESKNSSSEEVRNIIAKALTKVKATVNGVERAVNAVYIRPGVLMITRHFFKEDPYKDEMMDHLDLYMVTNGVKHKCRAYSKCLVRIDGKDMALLKVPKAPKMAKAIDYMLPKKTGTDHIRTRLLFTRADARFAEEIVNAKYIDNLDSAGFSCGRGLQYVSQHTKYGFCGTPVVADRKDGALLGFHVAGRDYMLTSRLGFAQEILYEDYKVALEKLEKFPHYISTPEMGTLRTTRFGLNLIPGKGPHPKTQVFEEGFMDPYPCMQLLGHDPALVRYRSRVRKGLLSDSIEKHFGIKCHWKAPYLKEPWVHHNKALKFVAEGAWEVPPDSLQWAVDDYWNQIQPSLRKHMDANPGLCRPLSIDEAINGVAGSLYMGPFKMDTAAGIPSGSKADSGLFVELEPYEDGRKRCALTPIAQKYYDEMVQVFDKGETFGIWVRTCLKDEVVEEESEKVRIFYILECIFGLMCRQYYLPIAEFISRYPLITECMVGVNCAGPEWEKMVSHLNEHAVDGQLTDWDYKKYDLKRSPDVMIASLKLMRRIAEYMLFPESILHRMDGVSEELRCPIVNWNGTVIWMFIWCSGNTITVYGNSLENSLHQRISFHWNGVRELGDEFHKIGSFSENEHIITYGDDGCSGSKPEIRKICDFHAKQKYFSFVNMTITDAKKSDDPQSTVDSDTVDFLKRRSVYHKELGCRVGALDVNSIWKMGHMSSGTGEPEDLAIASMQSMLTEAFLHGEDFYENVRSKLQSCARENNVWTDVLENGYQDKVLKWHEKYSPSERL